MPIPSSSTVRQRPEFAVPFTEFAEMPKEFGFVGMQVLAPIDVPTQKGELYVEPIEQELQKGELKRAPDGTYNRITDEFTERSYATKELGLESRLSDRMLRAYRDLPSAEASTVRRLMRRVMRSIERSIATALTATGSGEDFENFSDDTSSAGYGGDWSVHGTATPMSDIAKMQKLIYDNSGLIPDTLVMSYKKLIDLTLNQEIRGAIKYWGGDDPKPGNLMKKLPVLASALGVQRILIAGAVRATSDKGQDIALSPIWPNAKVGLYVTAPAGSDMDNPCVGRLATWPGDEAGIGMGDEPEIMVESYREDQSRSEIFRSRGEVDIDNAIWYPEAGYVLDADQS